MPYERSEAEYRRIKVDRVVRVLVDGCGFDGTERERRQTAFEMVEHHMTDEAWAALEQLAGVRACSDRTRRAVADALHLSLQPVPQLTRPTFTRPVVYGLDGKLRA